MAEKLNAFFLLLQNYPAGEHLIRIVATGIPILCVIALTVVSTAGRGWMNFLFASGDERKRLHDGNAAFLVNQLFIFVGFAIALGATLVNTASIAEFVDKVLVALVIQIAAMFSIRVMYRKAHHRMLAGNVTEGIRLGIIVLVVGIVTAFGMMR